MIFRGVRLAPLLSLLAGCLSAPPVPVDRSAGLMVEDGRLLLQGRLSGDVVAWFLFDTGSGDYSVIDPQLTRAMGLEHELVRGGDSPLLGVRTELPWIEFAGEGREHMTMYVEDFSVLAHLRGLSCAGVLGTRFFRDSRLLLSPSRGTFTTHPASLQRPGTPGELALRWGEQGILLLAVQVNGRVAQALLDTGAARSKLAPEFAARVGTVVEPADAAEPPRLEGVELDLAGRRRSLDVLFVAREAAEVPGVDLILGMDALVGDDLLFDLGEAPRLSLQDPSTED